MMNSSPSPSELRKQESAESVEGIGAPCTADRDIEAYRWVIRAARQPVADQLPADFAEQVARLVNADEDIGFIERWFPMMATGLLLAAGVFSSADMLGGALAEATASMSGLGLERLPWSMLLPAGLALGLAAVSEKVIAARWR